MGIDLDLTEIERMSEEFVTRVDEAMAGNDEFVAYVNRLEAEGTEAPIDPNSSARMIMEIEEFLRERRS